MEVNKSGQPTEQEKYLDIELGKPPVPVSIPRKESRLHALTRRRVVFIPMVTAAVVLVVLGVLGLVFLPSRHMLAGATGDQGATAFSHVPTVKATLPNLDLPARAIVRRHEQHLHNSTSEVDVMPKLNMTTLTNMTAHPNYALMFNHTKTLADDAEVEGLGGPNADGGKMGLITGVDLDVAGALLVLFLLCSCRTCRH